MVWFPLLVRQVSRSIYETTLDNLNLVFQVLNKYCTLIDDADRRLEIASKYNCPETIVEVSLSIISCRNI